jgi:predicted RNA-binding protein
MAYYTNIFSPETYQSFMNSDKTVSGFRVRQKSLAEKVKAGDIFICYLVRLSRWCGLLEVVDGPYEDSTPLFLESDDPFIVRFHVRVKVWLPLTQAIPIHSDQIWQHLSFTQNIDKSSSRWTGLLRNSLNKISEKDGKLLTNCLLQQNNITTDYPLNEQDQKKLKTHTVNRTEKVVKVSVPSDSELVDDDAPTQNPEVRESIKMQALLAQIGTCMGMKIWLPKADRSRVLKEWKKGTEALLEKLPLNYDETTLNTIEQIDVIWLKGRSITRAFEVEHTTSVYSGILRMADLLALQPNMNIKLHIVAPDSRQEKVFQEIRRPVFSLLESGPLSDRCSYIPYSNLKYLSKVKHLERMTDAVLEDYTEHEA